jgi:integrase/recombinase XerC
MTWTSWKDDYVESLKSRGLSPATVAMRQTWLSRLEAFCETLDLAEPVAVTLEHLEAWRDTLEAASARGTLLIALWSIRGFFGWAWRSGRLLVNPAADLVVPQARFCSTRLLTPEQVECLLTPPEPATPVALRNWAVLETLYGTAIRRGECQALDLLDADLRDGTLRIRHGKGRHSRVVPLGPHLVRVLDTYLQHARRHLAATAPGEPALFVGRGGERLGNVAIGLLVRQAGWRIGLPTLAPHALRRACATHTLAAGADLQSVQQLLGHASPDTTEHYTSISWEQIKAEHGRTHPRAVPPSDN